MEKICSCCGKKVEVFEVDEKEYFKKLGLPNSMEARDYYMLWHFMVEKCDDCDCVSRDISNCEKSKEIVGSDAYKNLFDENEKELNSRSNIGFLEYVKYGYIQERLGNYLESGKAYFLASDLAFATYYQVLLEDDEVDGFETVCDKYFKKALEQFQLAYENSDDIEAKVLYIAGLLADEDENKSKALQIVKEFLAFNPPEKYKNIVKFLLKNC